MDTTTTIPIDIPEEQLAAFCRRHHVSRLALFGSVVTGSFTAESDVDILVSFQPDARIGFLQLARMQRELSQLLGHPVDLVPQSGLKPLIRDHVLAESREIYAA